MDSVRDPEDLESYEAKKGYTTSSYPQKNVVGRIMASVDPKILMITGVALAVGALILGFHTNLTIFTVLLTCMVMLLFAVYLAQWVLAKDEGTPDMTEVSDAIRDGAEGFFRTQYGTISKLAIFLSVIIYVIYMFRPATPEQEAAGITRSTLAGITTFSFLFGALCSGLSGYIGMWVSVRANIRVAGGARRTAREALQIALRAGGFSGMMVVSMTVLGVSVLFTAIYVFFEVGVSDSGLHVDDVPLLLVGYGFGASFVALFAQLGGGIYTKAADVGADLVGKVEAGIPEDDPRNPAVIADLVGDNVGDCSARGADLFESIGAEIISAMILGGSLAKKAKLDDSIGLIMFPLVVHTLDLIVSAAGIMSIKGTASPARNQQQEDPYEVLKSGYQVSVGMSVITFGVACHTLLNVESVPGAWMYFYGCGLVGMATAYAFVWITQYYTDYKYKPVRIVAEASTTGHGTNIIAGVALGMESTAMPVVCISIAVCSAYWMGQNSGIEDANGVPIGGLFGTAVATMGMLSTAAYVLTMDVFGPIADNAGGIVEMSSQPENVREITDLLDAVGNTTKATTKGYAIGSAALASFLLFSAYMDEVSSFTGIPFKEVDIAIPEVWIGGLIGSMLVFLFSSLACSAVGRSAQAVVSEVRLQFLQRPGIMTYHEKPDYGRCVSIVAASALKEMVKPGMLAVFGPIVVGSLFKYIGLYTGQTLLGAKVVAGMLMFATVTGILMALFLNNAGGAWDNAKKYVETGAFGGKNSEAHKAAVTGDTVGDPFKDTAGPSLHVLIKMLATITLVMAPLFLD
eukprot:CAMPEP_0197850278 /NCGR_PEP_ID=MMETSP1438-20131217/14870_1 /TAXON_ID=1461541 /ORGANISM="Pterosperma sp., Strain CCMP1384" /LENGTH=800 /DNA_ID=CAMNT_0043463359 /DNA_START=265 /DNA_END=2667 /DNA_ORIENTATION=+